MRCPCRQRALVLLLAALVFLTLLGRRDIVTSHEGRVAQVARIMADAGWPWDAKAVEVPVMKMTETDGMKELRPDLSAGRMNVNPWLVPVINDQPRLQKPPLPYWCAAMIFRMFKVSAWSARLVPATLGAIAILLIWDLAVMILGRRAGMIAAGVWLSTYFIVDEYRKAMADPYLAFFTLLCVWSWLKGHHVSVGSAALRRGIAQRRRWIFVVIFYIALSLGALAKGPVILVTVVLPIAIWHVLFRVRPTNLIAHLIGIAIFALIVVPWPLYILHHVPNAMHIWRYESVGEMTGENVEKARPWWMYIGNSFQLPLPWTPMWIAGFVIACLHIKRRKLSPRQKRRLLAIAWYVVIVAFFSISSVKKPAYLLPAMPAQTLIVTDALLVLIAFARRTRFRGMPVILAMAQAMLAIGFAAGITVVLARSQTDRSPGVIGGCIAILMSLAVFAPIARRSAHQWLTMQVLAYAAILIVFIGLLRSADENRRSPRAFANALANYLPTARAPLAVHALPEDVAFYLPLHMADVADLPYALLVVDHSPKDPPETPESLTARFGEGRVIDADPIALPGVPSTGRWRLFEIRIDRSGPKT